MRALTLICVLLLGFASEARQPLPKFRSLFEFTQAHGAIRTLQIDVLENKGASSKDQWSATVKAKLADGSVRKGHVRCRKVASDEFKCRREDDGGGFTLRLGPTAPRLTFVSFSVADEGETLAADIRSSDDRPVSVDGSKRPLTTRDEF